MGNFAGLVGGLAVSVFSKPLAVVIGLLVFWNTSIFFSTPSTQPSSRSAATEAL